VAEDAIQDITSVLTVVGGRIVHGAEEFAGLAPPLPPAMPDWSPVRTHGGYQGRLRAEAVESNGGGALARLTAACGCGSECGVHGHDHTFALATATPTRDERSFWGALGCSCFFWPTAAGRGDAVNPLVRGPDHILFDVITAIVVRHRCSYSGQAAFWAGQTALDGRRR
jgi:hypothetical protein